MTKDLNLSTSKVLPATRLNFGMDQLWFWASLAVAALLLVAISLWPSQAEALNQEGGLIETVSAACLFVAGIAALVRFRGLERLYIGLVCLLLAERELEADIYAVGTAPFFVLNELDRLLDMTVVQVVLAILVLGGLVWHGIPTLWRAVKLRAPFLSVFVLAGLVAVVTQGLEEFSDIYEASLSPMMITRLFVLEETLEMYFSIGILASVLIGWPKEPTEVTPNDRDAARRSDTR